METRRSDVSIRNGHGVSEEAAGAPGRAPQGPPRPGAGGSRSPVLTEHGSNLRSVRRSELRERRKTGEKINKTSPELTAGDPTAVASGAGGGSAPNPGVFLLHDQGPGDVLSSLSRGGLLGRALGGRHPTRHAREAWARGRGWHWPACFSRRTSCLPLRLRNYRVPTPGFRAALTDGSRCCVWDSEIAKTRPKTPNTETGTNP